MSDPNERAGDGSVGFDLALVGFGHVARRFVTLIEERSDILAREYGLTCKVVGIATRRHGTAINPAGLPASQALELAESGASSLARLTGAGLEPPADALALIETLGRTRRSEAGSGRVRPLVVVETTLLDIREGQPAIDHVRAAFAAGAHVITANKGPIAFAYDALRREAAARGVTFRFESAVMDGVPIFNLVRETLPAVRIRGFRGVVNSTTNHILTAMEQGQEYAEALADMQAQGIAEADASLDVDGWDAAAKTAALANVLMEARITPQSVTRAGIASVTREQVRAALGRGRRVKLVATVRRADDRHPFSARVEPLELPMEDPLGSVSGMANALVLETDLLGDIAITQLEGGLTQTAYGLLSDLVSLPRPR